MKQRVKRIISKIWTAIRLLTIELIIVMAAFVSSFIIVVQIIKLIFLKKHEYFDHRVFDFVQGFVSDTNTGWMKFFTFLGSHQFLVPANLLLIIDTFFIRKDKWFAIRVASVALSSLALMMSLKYFFNRPRPLIPLLEQVPGLSFPSGHAFMSISFYGLLIYMVNKKVSTNWIRYTLIILLLFLIHIIGFSRIYLRVHYASDVIAGFAMGLMWLMISLWAVHIVENYWKSKRITP